MSRILSDEDQQIVDAQWDALGPKIGLPARLLGASLWDPSGQTTQALERARTFMADGEYRRGECLVLTGPTGVGKSWAAAAALRAAYRQPRRFWYFPALCGALLNQETRAHARERATQAPFAVFDDFGVEYLKEGGLIDAFLDEIIWTREANYLATLITTNLTTEGLRERLPARLVDRLAGTWGHVFECPGESLRTS
jgi:DNA replication protein DnaC